MANIGIIGLGVVGRALAAYYRKEHQVYTHDKADDAPEVLTTLNANADIVFICVGTPALPDGKLDCREVWNAVDALTGEKTVIIKSTVMPGTTDRIQALYRQHSLLFVPEFLNEETAVEDYAHPRRAHVVGLPDTMMFPEEQPRLGCPCEIVPEPPWGIIWSLLPGPDVVITTMSAKQAELLKLATNAFYALKVTFANMLYDIGVTQETLDALGTDASIGGEHFQVLHKGYRGFGGKCLPKDTKALATYASHDLAELLHMICMYNDRLSISRTTTEQTSYVSTATG